MVVPTELLDTAVRAARAGATALAPFLAGSAPIDVSEKSRHDFVTAADIAVERAVAAEILRSHPGHRILGEEEAHADLSLPGPVWIVDPLDGTTNFIHGYPVFAVSVGCAESGRVLAGAVFDPSRNELFVGARGHGAEVNGRRLCVSARRTIHDALIGTGFPFRQLERVDAYLATLRDVIEVTAGVRRPGSASLDLCAVAAGRYDGFWEQGLKPWDMAAASVMIEEAGGTVTDFHGDGAGWLEGGDVVTGAPGVHEELLAIVARHLGG
jgi:myo-inositol-1(or 4)-monophosphatase